MPVAKKTPFQVYLDAGDRKRLGQLADRHGLSMAEAVRVAINRWVAESSDDEDAVLALIGTMDDPGLPRDLSVRHDEYAVTGAVSRADAGARRKGRTRP